MTIRKLHRIVGVCFAPFFLITACTGAALLWRNAGIFSFDTKGTMLGLHNWEGLHGLGIHYLGVLLAAGLTFMAVTGTMLWAQMILRKKRRS